MSGLIFGYFCSGTIVDMSGRTLSGQTTEADVLLTFGCTGLPNAMGGYDLGPKPMAQNYGCISSGVDTRRSGERDWRLLWQNS